MLTWLHIGDLHAADEDDWASIDALDAIAHEARLLGAALDLIYLPGDIANHGEPEQCRRVAEALSIVPQPVVAISGDHDFEPKSLTAFAQGLAAFARSPKLRIDSGGCRCLFLDVVSAGTGGPDFRLDPAQRVWQASAPVRGRPGDHSAFIGAWPSHGLMGTRFGPNANGAKW